MDSMNNDLSTSLITIGEEPYVGETPEPFLDTWLTPNNRFYIRSHFNFPQLSSENLLIPINGFVENPLTISMKDIKRFPKHTLPVTLECAGNNRSDLLPKVPGNQFNSGAVSNAIWTGTPLKEILNLVNVKNNVSEILFKGADVGVTDPNKPNEPYLRSLSLEMANHPDTILAYEMNGEELPIEHGYPLRLIVPGWYGMASVKWISEITAIEKLFSGYFQGKKYVLKYKDGTEKPLEKIHVKSLVTYPLANTTFEQNDVAIEGIAWSGYSGIKKVEISVDGGIHWNNASLIGPSEKYSWHQWHYKWINPDKGNHSIISRAIDGDGNIQPIESVWNELGYAVNGCKPVSIVIE
jgi:DMSO/TMAO reductase YedYZ molybdopterin-dependent catalytic subunit